MLGGGARAGIKRRLMRRGLEELRIAIGKGLGAVAVMDVEIHHRDALRAMRGPRMKGAEAMLLKRQKPMGISGSA
jgi:hypothetical protein